MDYRKLYNSIIDNAKPRGLDKRKLCGYFEKHHIIPKCLNGTNNYNNLVLLTAREHYICHKLLTKIYKSNHLIFLAFHIMCVSKCKNYKNNRHTPRLTSSEYNNLRIGHSKSVSHLHKGKQKSQQFIDNLKNKHLGENNPFFGKTHTNETRQLISDFNKNNTYCVGRKYSEDTLQKMRESKLNMSEKTKDLMKLNHADVTGIKNPNHKSCIIDNIKYDLYLAACKALGIGYITLVRRLNSEKFPSWIKINNEVL